MAEQSGAPMGAASDVVRQQQELGEQRRAERERERSVRLALRSPAGARRKPWGSVPRMHDPSLLHPTPGPCHYELLAPSSFGRSASGSACPSLRPRALTSASSYAGGARREEPRARVARAVSLKDKARALALGRDAGAGDARVEEEQRRRQEPSTFGVPREAVQRTPPATPGPGTYRPSPSGTFDEASRAFEDSTQYPEMSYLQSVRTRLQRLRDLEDKSRTSVLSLGEKAEFVMEREPAKLRRLRSTRARLEGAIAAKVRDHVFRLRPRTSTVLAPNGPYGRDMLTASAGAGTGVADERAPERLLCPLASASTPELGLLRGASRASSGSCCNSKGEGNGKGDSKGNGKGKSKGNGKGKGDSGSRREALADDACAAPVAKLSDALGGLLNAYAFNKGGPAAADASPLPSRQRARQQHEQRHAATLAEDDHPVVVEDKVPDDKTFDESADSRQPVRFLDECSARTLRPPSFWPAPTVFKHCEPWAAADAPESRARTPVSVLSGLSFDSSQASSRRAEDEDERSQHGLL
jgi:hypothetical protein